MGPLFSVIIPLYNKELYISKTLNSVLCQNFTDFEIIIVNDGSTDNSEKSVLDINDSRIKYYFKNNEGVSATRNFGIKKAKGKYIAFLDADDYWYPDHLKEILNLISIKPHLSVFTSLLEVQTKNNIYSAKYSISNLETYNEIPFFTSSFSRVILSGSTTVIKTDVVENIGYFNTDFDNGEDTDYWIRIGLKYNIGLVNKITARHVFVENSLSKKPFNMDRTCKFNQFAEAEKSDKNIKKMIDINRFSLALKCKMTADYDNFNYFKSVIDNNSLSLKQNFILKLPKSILITLYRFKSFLERINIKSSAF